MPEIAITLVGSFDENRAAETVRALGVNGLRIDILEPGRAVDILVNGGDALIGTIRQAFAASPFDVFVQPNDEYRRKKVLVADMDATMVEEETLDELAAHLGLKDQIAPITQRAMRGELDFREALTMRVKMLKGLPVSSIETVLSHIKFSAGAAALVKTMRAHGARCVLVSGGFTFFTSYVAQSLGFHENVANRLEIINDKMTGEVMPPIIDKDAKERLLIQQGDPRFAIAVGDGANDIPMLRKAGVGVGYFGKPAVVAAVPHQVRHTDLRSLLYLQGYRQQEITKT